MEDPFNPGLLIGIPLLDYYYPQYIGQFNPRTNHQPTWVLDVTKPDCSVGAPLRVLLQEPTIFNQRGLSHIQTNQWHQVVCLETCMDHLYIYICVDYICMHACMYVCMDGCMHACTYVRTYVCMYICIYAYMYICIYIYTSFKSQWRYQWIIIILLYIAIKYECPMAYHHDPMILFKLALHWVSIHGNTNSSITHHLQHPGNPGTIQWLRHCRCQISHTVIINPLVQHV